MKRTTAGVTDQGAAMMLELFRERGGVPLPGNPAFDEVCPDGWDGDDNQLWADLAYGDASYNVETVNAAAAGDVAAIVRLRARLRLPVLV